MVTLKQVRAMADRHTFPTTVLEGCESALVLFAAGFHGAQDAIHIAEAGLTATCVDTDHEKLGEMVLAYPEGWEYVHGDAFEYATRTERRWDVVSVDCPSNLFERCAELLPLWTLLARKAVVIGHGLDESFDIPSGWEMTDLVKRSKFRGGVYWRVFERA